MEPKKSLKYLRAKKKVKMLKGFYGHLIAFILINIVVILVSANFLGKGKADFSDWGNYIMTILWGIGLFFHALYVFFDLYLNNKFLRRWEENKINQFLKEEKRRN